MEKQGIKFCPRCKSANVQREMNILLVFGAPQEWKCNTCNFKGHIFPEINKNKTMLKKQKSRNKK